jgi:hypothetical protein
MPIATDGNFSTTARVISKTSCGKHPPLVSHNASEHAPSRNAASSVASA